MTINWIQLSCSVCDGRQIHVKFHSNYERLCKEKHINRYSENPIAHLDFCLCYCVDLHYAQPLVFKRRNKMKKPGSHRKKDLLGIRNKPIIFLQCISVFFLNPWSNCLLALLSAVTNYMSFHFRREHFARQNT